MGTVDFPLHVAKGLAADYDGVVTFVFDSSGDAQVSASFLYKAADGGLRFTSPPGTACRISSSRRSASPPW